MTDDSAQPPLLFETSWETAHKVGGIYTVISTKVPRTMKEFGDRYFLLGPYFSNSSYNEVEMLDPPPVLAKAVDSLTSQGFKLHYGKWLISESPNVLLFDLDSARHKLGEWRWDMSANYHITIPEHNKEVNDAVILGYLVSWFLDEVSNFSHGRSIVAHFHEWQAGCGAMLCRGQNRNIATIFTTHATLLGRYICAGDGNLYEMMEHINPDKEAGDRNIFTEYSLERAAAHSAHVFTTVSEITAKEAKALLGREPDIVTPNGLNGHKFQALHEFQNLHAEYKEVIKDFVRGHFYGSYDFDIDNTMFFFIAGRHEYRNKGADMYLDSLKILNDHLKRVQSPLTIVAFVIMPGQVKGFNVESLNGQAQTRALRQTVERIKNHIGDRMFETCLRGTVPSCEKFLDDDDIVALKRRIFSLRRQGLPPITTHSIKEGVSDPVLDHIRRVQLFNRPEDRVKIVYHPEFLNSSNPLIGLEYDQFVRGCHLGIFPSYYEPWGYTPAECTVMGIPSVCSNLSGFGGYIERYVQSPDKHGIFVIDRLTKSYSEGCQQLAAMLSEFTNLSRRERIAMRNRTERLSEVLDWKRMSKYYKRARALALHRKYPLRFPTPHFSDARSDQKVQTITTPKARLTADGKYEVSLEALSLDDEGGNEEESSDSEETKPEEGKSGTSSPEGKFPRPWSVANSLHSKK